MKKYMVIMIVVCSIAGLIDARAPLRKSRVVDVQADLASPTLPEQPAVTVSQSEEQLPSAVVSSVGDEDMFTQMGFTDAAGAHEVLANDEPSVASLYGDESTLDDEYENRPGSKKSGMSPKAVALTVAIGVLVVGALLEGLGTLADKKAAAAPGSDSASGLWSFFSSIRPSAVVKKAMGK